MWLRVTALLLATLVNSYAHCGSQSQFSFRGIWADPSAFSTREAADRLVAQCKRAGLNAIMADVMAHGSLLYKSPHFLHRVLADEKFDPLGNLVYKAHAAGIQVHAWFCVYYEGGSSLSPARPDWICRDFDGNPVTSQVFMSPCIPGVNEYLLSVISDVLAYDIDGIHLDYIRYAGTPYDYSAPARERFNAAYGFDPIKFLDHGESLVPPQREPFPIRMLHPDAHKTKPWETTRIESLLDRAGVGFAWISEKPENINALPIPSLLILAHYYDVPDKMVTAIERYVSRGGRLIWIDAPTTTLRRNKRLANLLGVSQKTRWVPSRWMSLITKDSNWRRFTPLASFKSTANMSVEPTCTEVKVRFASGEPAVLLNEYASGKVVLVNFTAGSASGTSMPNLIAHIVGYLSPPQERSGANVMAAKRAQWIKWRANQVTSLVRNVKRIAKKANRDLAVSAAGGFNGSEHYTVFRDCNRWLLEGLLDFGCPMDYTEDLQQFANLLEEHLTTVPGEAANRIYPGIALYRRDTSGGKTPSQKASIVRKELEMVRDKGFKGFVLFSSVQLTENQIEQVAQFQ